MRKIILLFTAAITFYNSLSAQNTNRSFIKDSLDNYVAKAMHDWNIPGVAVCIIKDSQVVIMKVMV